MARVEVDFNIEDTPDGFTPVPDDQYVCKVTKADLTTAKTSGKPMIKIEMEIIDGDFAERKLFDNIPLHVDFKVASWCRAVGIESGSELDTDDFIGQEVVVTVVTEASDGYDPSNKIKKVKSAAA